MNGSTGGRRPATRRHTSQPRPGGMKIAMQVVPQADDDTRRYTFIQPRFHPKSADMTGC
jgi:hypothetical protein